MNALVKKEIRLLLPSWMVAMLLALVQAITRPYDFYVACLLFFGLTIMALTTFGRETSLNTFSLLLAQPAERMRIWQTKLSVLAVAFLTVFVSWLACFIISGLHGFATNNYDDYNLFITICLIATATFTGGLWTTLLLRQIAGAFWLTLLVPAVLSGVSAVFLAQNESSSTVIAVLCVVFAVYSVGGFLFARWLFFRAQDVGWSGGVISLPDWPFSAALPDDVISPRNRKPIFALMKKEFQLQQVSLMGAVGLLALHIGIIALRKYHQFAKDSAGEVVTCIFWILWLVMPVIIGCMAVAEERSLGVMEGQLCQPASRRIQFGIKFFVILFLGILLGGVMPLLLETIGVALGAQNPAFLSENHKVEFGLLVFALGTAAFSAWLALVSFFASSLAKNFLQAVGYAIATLICLTMIIPALADERIRFYGSISLHFILLLVIAIPIITTTLLWLAYLNYKNFRDGWPLWRRNLLGFAGAFVFIIVTSIALYNRVWEVFQSLEPPHGPPKLTLANPLTLRCERYNNLLVRLPDGRVWFDGLRGKRTFWQMLLDPLLESAGPQRFINGSNWVSATVCHVDTWVSKDGSDTNRIHVSGYLPTVGIQSDGSLWFSDQSDPQAWPGDRLVRFGDDTNWQQVAQSVPASSVLLLKKDGTLWRWGSPTLYNWKQWPQDWLELRTFQPRQIGTDSNWKELYNAWNNLARKVDDSVWKVSVDDKSGTNELRRDSNLDQVAFQTLSSSGNGEMAYVRPDGTLWMSWDYQQNGTSVYSGFVQVGTETNWTAVALNWQKMVALKSDGSLWQWHFARQWNVSQEQLNLAAQESPIRLGIHNDWVAIANTWEDVIALAADGSLWLWPNRDQYERFTLLKLPKQPEFLGNIFGKPD